MTKVNRAQATLVLLAALLTASTACEAPSAPQSILVSGVVREAVSAAEELTETAFDRLDASMSLAASQARAVVSHTAEELAHVASHTLDELDDQERRLVSDLQRLTREIEATMGRVAEGVLEPVRQDVFLLLSRDAGYLAASGGYAIRGAEELSFELKGTALSRAELLDYQVSSKSATPGIRERDDTRIALTVSLVEGVGADLIARSNPQAILQIPVTFRLEECSWFGLVCRPTRAFVLAGAVFPEELGVARAVFAGDMRIEERKSRTVAHFPRVEVKSGMFGGSKTETETFSVHPTRPPWRIDVESLRTPDYQVSDYCRSGRSRADILSATAELVRVKVKAESQSNPSVWCRVRFSLTFDEIRTPELETTLASPEGVLRFGERVALSLEASELRNARLVHVEVESQALSDGRKILWRGEEQGGVSIHYDTANPKTAYIEVKGL